MRHIKDDEDEDYEDEGRFVDKDILSCSDPHMSLSIYTTCPD